MKSYKNVVNNLNKIHDTSIEKDKTYEPKRHTCSVVIPQKNWTLLKCLTGNLHIIAYQLTKFQAPSSNSLRHLADKFKMPKFSKGHNSGKIKWIVLKFDQVIYSSSAIS